MFGSMDSSGASGSTEEKCMADQAGMENMDDGYNGDDIDVLWMFTTILL